MIKLIFISILIIFTGCVKKEVVYFQNQDSNSYNSNNYKTTKPKNRIIKKNITKTTDKKVNSRCETEITEIFNSKASGKITICKGKILTDGKKSKIIYVNK
ncbi:MAG: hypothetical protein U9Q30_10025 [Campylobacterota bacterium]|nr:hypothetical protein [Campylobacterota bacterium]